MAFPPSNRWVLEFDGIDDFVEMAGFSPTSSFTLALDIQFESIPPSGSQGVIEARETGVGINIFIQSSSTLYVDIHFGSGGSGYAFVTGIAVSIDLWYRVVMTYNGSILRVYLNGTEVGTDTQSLTFGSFSGNMRLGYGTSFHGMAANFRIWSAVLDAEQVADLDAQTSNLIRHYALDEGTGTNVANSGSDSSADGTIIGATWFFIEGEDEGVITRLTPNAIIATENLQDTNLDAPPVLLSDIQDEVDDPDANWWTAVDPTLQTKDHLGDFRRPDGSPIGGALVGAQKFRTWRRKTAGTPNPTLTMNLREDGVLVRALLSDVEVTSTTGQLFEGDWDASEITDSSLVECEVIVTPGEGFT